MTPNQIRYQEYLQTDHWAKVKQRYRKSATRRRHDNRVVCKLCSNYGPLDIHHLTYARVGKERTTDVVGLCRSCHQFIHDTCIVTGESRAMLPTKIKKLRKQWWRYSNRNKLWSARIDAPEAFSRLSSEFFYRLAGHWGMGKQKIVA